MLPSRIHSILDNAHRYATEPERLTVIAEEPFAVHVRGLNSEHDVSMHRNHLVCNCEGYGRDGICAHVVTVELTHRDRVHRDDLAAPRRRRNRSP
jgi:hypothetical protein